MQCKVICDCDDLPARTSCCPTAEDFSFCSDCCNCICSSYCSNYCSFKCFTANFIAAHRHRRVCHSHWNGTKQTSSQINHLARASSSPILHPPLYFMATFPPLSVRFFPSTLIYLSFGRFVLLAMWRKIMLYGDILDGIRALLIAMQTLANEDFTKCGSMKLKWDCVLPNSWIKLLKTLFPSWIPFKIWNPPWPVTASPFLCPLIGINLPGKCSPLLKVDQNEWPIRLTVN